MSRKQEKMAQMESGATRSSNEGKPDYRGYISPLAIEMFGRYMLKHQVQADGQLRKSDNWKKGMPLERYVESKIRHDVAFWKAWETYLTSTDPAEVAAAIAVIEEEISAVYFNVQGFMHEWVKLWDSEDKS